MVFRVRGCVQRCVSSVRLLLGCDDQQTVSTRRIQFRSFGTLCVLLSMPCHMVCCISYPADCIQPNCAAWIPFRVSACCGVQKGSLDGALRGIAPPGDGPPRLHWHLRIRLAAACADALSYLQSQPPQVGAHHHSPPVCATIAGQCIGNMGLHLRQEFDKRVCLSQ